MKQHTLSRYADPRYDDWWARLKYDPIDVSSVATIVWRAALDVSDRELDIRYE